MTYQELVNTIKKLPRQQRQSLLLVLERLLQEDVPVEKNRPSSLPRVRGMLQVEGTPPSDEELLEEYTDYLIEKYA